MTIDSDNESHVAETNDVESIVGAEEQNDTAPMVDANPMDHEMEDGELNDNDKEDGHQGASESDKENVRPQSAPIVQSTEAVQQVPAQHAPVQQASAQHVLVQHATLQPNADQQSHAQETNAAVLVPNAPFIEKKPNVNEASSGSTARVKPRIACSECEQIFVKKAYWVTHMKYDHDVEIIIPGKYVRANKRKSVLSEDNGSEDAVDHRTSSPMDPANKRHKKTAK